MKKIFYVAFIFMTFLSENSYSQVNCDTIIPPPSQSNYILPYPVGKTYCITQSYCSNGGHANLFAYDFNTQLGDTITACRSGLVVFVNEQYSDSDWVNGHENNVFIQHNDGTRMRYTHLKQFGVFVTAGQVVTAGQPLALSGSSGNTGGVPHLHLQGFRDGSSYNGFNSIPYNFSNTSGPVNSQNLCINGGCYPALDPLSINVNYYSIPDDFHLYQNYPNPFNPSTIIKFGIPHQSVIKLSIYDVEGRTVMYAVDQRLDAGTYEFSFNGEYLPSGIYFYRLQSDEYNETRRMILLK